MPQLTIQQCLDERLPNSTHLDVRQVLQFAERMAELPDPAVLSLGVPVAAHGAPLRRDSTHANVFLHAMSTIRRTLSFGISFIGDWV